jgi:hypothetical protein
MRVFASRQKRCISGPTRDGCNVNQSFLLGAGVHSKNAEYCKEQLSASCDLLECVIVSTRQVVMGSSWEERKG